MTIAALYGRDAERHFGMEGLAVERVEAPAGGARTLWLGRTGHGTDAQVEGDVLVVSEEHGGPSASAIAAAYAGTGFGCVARFEGSFSFVLYDRRRDLLFATSDLTSRAPLAYWFDREDLVVSSRALRILAHPRVRRELDEVYLANLVAGLAVAPPGTTALRDIKRLPAGVAIVSRAGEVELVAVDCLRPRSPGLHSKAACIDALWNELDLAVGRSSPEDPTCLSLSGGLDSAAIASVLARGRGPAPTASLSMVEPAHGAEEILAIQEIESAHPRTLTNVRIDVSGATSLARLDAFDLTDDPAMTPVAYLPARLRLWEASRRAGFRAMLDGEGGDELFGGLVGPRDAVGGGQLRAALSYVRDHKSRRALFLRSVLLPFAPRVVRIGWVERRARSADLLPSYLSTRARAHPAVVRALHDFAEMEIENDRESNLCRVLSNPHSVGASMTHRQLASAFGLRLRSPFLHRRVVELVLGIPVQWLLSVEYKGFLRDAAAGRVPEPVRRRAKDIAPPTHFMRKLVRSQAVRATLASRPVRERLEEWIRMERFEGMLDAIARGHDLDDPFLWHRAEGLVTFAYWFERAGREYGIT